MYLNMLHLGILPRDNSCIFQELHKNEILYSLLSYLYLYNDLF